VITLTVLSLLQGYWTNNKLGQYCRISQDLGKSLQVAKVDNDRVDDDGQFVSNGKNTEQGYWFNIYRLGKADITIVG